MAPPAPGRASNLRKLHRRRLGGPQVAEGKAAAKAAEPAPSVGHPAAPSIPERRSSPARRRHRRRRHRSLVERGRPTRQQSGERCWSMRPGKEWYIKVPETPDTAMNRILAAGSTACSVRACHRCAWWNAAGGRHCIRVAGRTKTGLADRLAAAGAGDHFSIDAWLGRLGRRRHVERQPQDRQG